MAHSHTIEHHFSTFSKLVNVMLVRDNLYFGMTSQKKLIMLYPRVRSPNHFDEMALISTENS